MLAVDGQNPRAVRPGRRHQERSRRDQRFLVGQRQRRALLQGRQPRRKPRSTNDGRHHPISRPPCRLDQRVTPGGGFHARAVKRGAQIRQQILLRHHRKVGPQRTRILRQTGNIAPARERHDVKGLRVSPNEVDRALPDRPGRAQNRYPLHATPGIRPRTQRITTKSAAPSIASNRSSTPPCPGMRLELSLTSRRRLIALSEISPICPAKPTRIDTGISAIPAPVGPAKSAPTIPAPTQPARSEEHTSERVCQYV